MLSGEEYPAYSRRIASQMTVDDWKAAAAYLNSKAKALETSGMRVGYHNHHLEFSPVGNTYGLAVLLAETDPKGMCGPVRSMDSRVFSE